jgi:hypothetical protein
VNDRLLQIAMVGLLVVLVMCLSGIIYLASANPARSIPDILVGTTTLIVGTIAGILVPRGTAG